MCEQKINGGKMGRRSLSGRFTSAQVIPLGFLGIIFIGAILLMLPFATVSGEETSFLTALFTSTTCVSVTGLVVVPTFSHWTLFGKIVILLLIQLGGLGIIAVSSIVILILGRRFSLKGRLMIMDSFDLNTLDGLVRFMISVLKGTFAVEIIGALLYMIRFIPEFGAAKGIFMSVFTSVSAFCNAGLDITWSDSMVSCASDPLVLTVTMLLIVTGGLGFIVWFDMASSAGALVRRKGKDRGRISRLSEHSKLVLVLTFALILSGAVFIFLLEKDNPATLGNMSTGDKILNSLFQSVTFRTAGFASVPQSGLTEASSLLGCILMFTGGSPMGTAGGVKTVTVFVLLLTSLAYIRHGHDTVVFSRRFSEDLVRKAIAIFTVNLLFTLGFTILLTATNPVSLTDGLYETTSAVATVGLSRDITSSLNGIGRIIIIAAMYLGRIGPISIALFFTGKSRNRDVEPAKGNFFVG